MRTPPVAHLRGTPGSTHESFQGILPHRSGAVVRILKLRPNDVYRHLERVQPLAYVQSEVIKTPANLPDEVLEIGHDLREDLSQALLLLRIGTPPSFLETRAQILTQLRQLFTGWRRKRAWPIPQSSEICLQFVDEGHCVV